MWKLTCQVRKQIVVDFKGDQALGKGPKLIQVVVTQIEMLDPQLL